MFDLERSETSKEIESRELNLCLPRVSSSTRKELCHFFNLFRSPREKEKNLSKILQRTTAVEGGFYFSECMRPSEYVIEMKTVALAHRYRDVSVVSRFLWRSDSDRRLLHNSVFFLERNLFSSQIERWFNTPFLLISEYSKCDCI